MPRACYACYRGNLAAAPKLHERDTATFVTARMGVNMAAPDVPTEMRNSITVWVDVMAFSDANRAKLLKCRKGETVMIMGNVTIKPYETQSGEKRIGRTIIADSLMAASASAPDDAGQRVEDATDPNAPPTT